MKRIAVGLMIISGVLAVALAGAQPPDGPKTETHTTPPPIHAAKGVIVSPYKATHRKHHRGLKKTPRFKLVSARRFDRTGIKVPAQIMMLPKQLSMWGNDQYGDCVTASEAARIAAYSVFCNLPETFIPEATAIAWAQKGGYLNGANLTDVMTDRQTRGMADANGKLYTAGPYTSVDYTDEATLQAALATGPVNFGIDADALPSAAGNAPGWYAFGGTPGSFSNEDHCTPCMGFVAAASSAQVAFQAISTAYNVTVSPPANAPAGNVYLWFTWNTVGVVDHAWIMSTAGEAWVQNPTTAGQTPGPTPTPVPPTPTPSPVPPLPPPGGVALTLTGDQVQSVLQQAGVSDATAKVNAAANSLNSIMSGKGKAAANPPSSNIESRVSAVESSQKELVSEFIKLQKIILGQQK